MLLINRDLLEPGQLRAQSRLPQLLDGTLQWKIA
jgi:hypothetical protein